MKTDHLFIPEMEGAEESFNCVVEAPFLTFLYRVLYNAIKEVGI